MIQEAPKKCKFLRGGDFFRGSMEHLDLTKRSQKKREMIHTAPMVPSDNFSNFVNELQKFLGLHSLFVTCSGVEIIVHTADAVVVRPEKIAAQLNCNM